MTVEKEELVDALSSSFWEELSVRLIEQIAETKDSLVSLPFEKPDAILQAVKLQGKLESLESILQEVEEIKEESI